MSFKPAFHSPLSLSSRGSLVLLCLNSSTNIIKISLVVKKFPKDKLWGLDGLIGRVYQTLESQWQETVHSLSEKRNISSKITFSFECIIFLVAEPGKNIALKNKL